MEPVLLQIPVARIRPNPNNSRPVITPEMVALKAVSLKADGQLDPIKVRPLTAEERAADPEHDYELIGGHIRLEAAKSLGWENLRALVFNYTAEEAVLPGIMDNKNQDRHWFCKYLDIEALLKVYPTLSQRQLADRLEMSLTVINEGLKLLKYLNPSARDLVVRAANKTAAEPAPGVRSANTRGTSKATRALAEAPVYCLMDLGSLPKTLEEIQELILKALKVLIDRQMGESEAQKLVEWVQSGNNLEDYGQKPAAVISNDPNDPHSSYWQNLPPNVKVTRTKRGYEVRASLAHHEGVPAVYGMLSNLEYLKGRAGEPEDLRFRNALPGVMAEGCEARLAERQAAAKQEAERQAALEAKAQASAQKAEAAKAKKDKALSKPEVASRAGGQPQVGQPSAEADSASANDSHEFLTNAGSNPSGSYLEKAAGVIQQKTGLDGSAVVDAIKSNLGKDLKSAVNTVIKQIFRRFLKRAI